MVLYVGGISFNADLFLFSSNIQQDWQEMFKTTLAHQISQNIIADQLEKESEWHCVKLRVISIAFGRAGVITFHSLINNSIPYERKSGIDILRNL